MISTTLFSSICIYLLTCQHHLHARPSIPVQQGLAPVGGTAAGITCVSPSDSRLPRGGTRYNGLYGEAPPERSTFFRLQVFKRVEISRAGVYERVGKSDT